MNKDEAIQVIARHAIAYGAARAVEQDGWELYPEIGGRDWEAVVERVGELATYPEIAEYDEAYKLLESRAEHESV